MEDWAWVNGIQALNQQSTWLRSTITTARQQIQAFGASLKATQESIASTAEWMQQPSETYEQLRSKLLGLRRQYPAILVGLITAASVLPGLRSGPRILLRNSIIGGGAGAVLLYPEFVMRTAAYSSKTATKMAKTIEERVNR